MHPLTPSITAVAQSVDLALTDGDPGSALEAVRAHWPALMAQSGDELRSIIERIPESHWERDAWVLTALGASYRSVGSPSRSAALPYFELAEAHAAPDSPSHWRLPAILLYHSACLRSLGRIDDAVEKVHAASALLHGGNERSALPWHLTLRADAALQLGLNALHLGDYGHAVSQLRLALGLSEQSLTPADRLECLGALAYASYASGDFEHADRFLARAQAPDVPAALHGSAYSAPALVAAVLISAERNQAFEARSLEAALAASAHRSDWEPLGYYARAASAAINGQLIEALDLQRRCVAAARDWQGEPVVRHLAATLRATLHRFLGDTEHAAELAQRVPATPDHVACPASLTAGIRLDAGDAAGCLEALRECLTDRDNHSARTLVTVLLLHAAASYELSETSAADLSFDQALYIGSTTGSRIPFLLIPRIIMLRMLNRAADRYQPDGVQRLLTELRVGSASTHDVVEPLSERELDVAQHLFEDKTVSQIAAELYISTNTVKTHVRSIYRKLSASNRKEAIRRVHELGLDVKITPF